jgi:hypothetical protein
MMWVTSIQRSHSGVTSPSLLLLLLLLPLLLLLLLAGGAYRSW